MAQPPDRPSQEELAEVDEAVAESFPASDAPAWTESRVGAPSHAPIAVDHVREIRSALRADVELLSKTAVDAEARRAMLEDFVARSMLDAGRAIVREPVDESLRVRNVEAEMAGTARDGSCVVVGARYDAEDPSGVAMLLAMVRRLSPARLRRSLRFIAFATDGSERYVQRLQRERVNVLGMLSLDTLDLPRDGRDRPVVFVANLRSSKLARAARRSFEVASRIPARAVVLPSWLPGVSASAHATFWRQRWPALLVTDRSPWRSRRKGAPIEPDVDRMVAALPGLVEVVTRLGGGRG